MEIRTVAISTNRHSYSKPLNNMMFGFFQRWMYTVSQKTRTPVTFSNNFKNVTNVNNFWYIESSKCLQCSCMSLVRCDKMGYQVRLFPWQQFTTDKLTTLVDETGSSKGGPISYFDYSLYKFRAYEAEKLMKEFS